MRRNRIALEESLSHFKGALQKDGFDVVDLSPDNLKNVSAYVISGEDMNVMGMQDSSTRQPVISARGKDVREISQELKNHFNNFS